MDHAEKIAHLLSLLRKGMEWHWSTEMQKAFIALLDRFARTTHLIHSDEPLPGVINLLNPTGYVMYQQFNIQQLYFLPTLYLSVLYLSENKQRLVPLTA